MVPVSVRPGHDERRAGSARSRGPSCPAVSGRSGQPAGRRARSPPCRGRPSAISSDRDHWHPAGNSFRGWNSTGRTRVLPPVGALVSPGPDHCLHGIPSGWSHDAPSAVRRPAHRLRHALASTRSGGAVMPGPVRGRPAVGCADDRTSLNRLYPAAAAGCARHAIPLMHAGTASRSGAAAA